MRRISAILVCILCMVIVVSATANRVTIEEQLNNDGYQAIEVVDGRSYKVTNSERTKLSQRRATTAVLQLPLIFTDNIYQTPEDIEGIVEDIPFNYFATIEQSSEYIYSLFNQGFIVTSYTATPLMIQLELRKANTRYRIIVYEDYLKVYAPEIGG